MADRWRPDNAIQHREHPQAPRRKANQKSGSDFNEWRPAAPDTAAHYTPREGYALRGKRADTHSVRYLGHQRLEDCFARGKGTSKHSDKHTDPEAIQDKIYMDNTCNQYHKHWDDYCDSMRRAGYTVDGHVPRTLEEAKGYMPQYIQELEARPGAKPGTTFSAWSVRAYFAAAGKVLGLSASDYTLPQRRRQDITRSRGEAARDRRFSTVNNADFVDFCRATGLRNAKELQQVRGTDLVDLGGGSYAIRVHGKGGRWRDAPIYGTPGQVGAVVGRLRAAGGGLVWFHVPSAADVHSYRADYAARVYTAHARPADSIPPADRYHCRGDMRGYCFDRRAMQIASEALGHSRLNVIAAHYLWRLVEDDI